MSRTDEDDDGAAVSSAALYAALAPVYDRWQALDGATPFCELALGQLEPVLRRRRAPVTSFVDLGCGTGDLLLALRARHPDWRLHGVDAAADMLTVARAKPGAASITWREQAIEDVANDEPFDVAGAFYDTLNHLPNRAALARAFAAVACLLAPGGLFVFDVTNALGFRRWWTGNRTWRGQDDAWQVQVEMAYQPPATDADDGTGLADVTVVEKNIARRATLTQRCFPDSVLRSALAGAGLDLESATTWSPFEIDAPGKTVFVAVKSTYAPSTRT